MRVPTVCHAPKVQDVSIDFPPLEKRHLRRLGFFSWFVCVVMMASAAALLDGHTVLSFLNGLGAIASFSLGIAFIGWSMREP